MKVHEKENARTEREAKSLAKREEQRVSKQAMVESKKLEADTRKRAQRLVQKPC